MDFEKSSLCSLDDHASFQDFLKGYGLSQSAARKHFSKKELAKKIRSKDELVFSNEVLNPFLICPQFTGTSPKILKESEDWLVLSKPEGLHSHPLSYNEGDNLLSFLKQQGRWPFLQCHADSWDRGLCFRLDLETSGVVLFTSNESLLKRVRNKEGVRQKKVYLCLVQGRPEDEGTLNHFLETGGKKTKVTEKGLPSQLKFKVLQYNEEKDCSLLCIELKEGRRHQIRVQLAHEGFPIVGYSLYGGVEAPRMFLHALYYELDFDGGNSVSAFDWHPSLFGDFLNLNGSLEMFRDQLFVG